MCVELAIKAGANPTPHSVVEMAKAISDYITSPSDKEKPDAKAAA
jgi:hypothetical protein